jgi:threonine dehydrogenase-like Zn-dependent dehydrogenase
MNRPLEETRVLTITAEETPGRRYRLPRIRVETRRLGRLRDDQIRVEMLYVGVCGTDLHLLMHDRHGGYVQTSAPIFIPPEGRVIGHEGVGRVMAAGAGIRSPAAGDIVAFASIIACMRCDRCQRGAFNQCRNASLLGMEADGLFGTVVDVPASIAYDVSHIVRSDRDLRAVACLEPAGVALLACETARVAPGDSVTIFGGGPIGVYCAMLCKCVLGAAHVALVEPLDFRRRSAAPWCHAAYDSDTYFSEERALVDVVIEASGDLGTISRIFRRIEANGRVVLLGRRGTRLTLDAVDHMITQAISIMGTRGHLGGSLSRVLTLYQAGTLPLDAVITSEVRSLDALLETLQDPEGLPLTQCKVVARIGPPLEAPAELARLRESRNVPIFAKSQH